MVILRRHSLWLDHSRSNHHRFFVMVCVLISLTVFDFANGQSGSGSSTAAPDVQSTTLEPPTPTLAPTGIPPTLRPPTRSPSTVATTPIPTYSADSEGSFQMKLIFFGAAFGVFAIPAILACICFAARHRRRLQAIRALQENRANKSGDGQFSISNISVQGGRGDHGDAGTPKGGVDVKQTCDFNHTPPELSLVPLTDCFPLVPFEEDEAVLQEEFLSGQGLNSGLAAGAGSVRVASKSAVDLSNGDGKMRSKSTRKMGVEVALGKEIRPNDDDDLNPFDAKGSKSKGTF
jgi:hypothetical protein